MQWSSPHRADTPTGHRSKHRWAGLTRRLCPRISTLWGSEGAPASRQLFRLAVWLLLFCIFLLQMTQLVEIKPVHPKRNQLWIFIVRTDTEAEAPILWPPDMKSQLVGKKNKNKNLDSGKDWGQGEKRAAEDEMVRWHHWLSEHEFEQTPGDGDGQGSLACCSPWGLQESDTTEWPNNNNSCWRHSSQKSV